MTAGSWNNKGLWSPTLWKCFNFFKIYILQIRQQSIVNLLEHPQAAPFLRSRRWSTVEVRKCINRRDQTPSLPLPPPPPPSFPQATSGHRWPPAPVFPIALHPALCWHVGISCYKMVQNIAQTLKWEIAKKNWPRAILHTQVPSKESFIVANIRINPITMKQQTKQHETILIHFDW